MIIARLFVEWRSSEAECRARRLIARGGQLESPEAKRPRRVGHTWYKADITSQEEYIYMYLNYTTTDIHHRYTIHTVLGTRPHTMQVHILQK